MILPSATPAGAFQSPYNGGNMNASPPSSALQHIRPFKIAQDLKAVTDLLEICFARPDDADSRRYIASMRRASRDERFLRWASTAHRSSLPLRGFVWEEDGRIVGNVNLAHFRHGRRFIQMIVNVAVHPHYRRRGIARALMQHTIRHAFRQGAASLWLQVREDNPGAIRLYEQLGFVSRARRTIWSVAPEYRPLTLPPHIHIAPRKPYDWQQQKHWLKALYPPRLSWFFSPRWQRFSPWPWDFAWRTLTDTRVRQWRVSEQGRLQAVVSWVAENNRRDTLWLAAPPAARPEALSLLLLHLQRKYSNRLELRLDLPAEQHQPALLAAGFQPLRTLLWMQLDKKQF